MKKNKKGSALMWAIAVIMVLEVAIAGACAISYSYYRRSVENHSARQAYVTAKAVIQDLVENINQKNDDYLTLFESLEEGETTSLILEDLDVRYGTVTGEIRMLPKGDTKGKITIAIKATYGNHDRIIKADMQLGNKEGQHTWQLVRYYENDEVDDINNNNAKGLALYSHASELLNIYQQNSKFADVLKYLQEDVQGWKNFVSSSAYSDRSFMDNTWVRGYYRYRNENEKYEEFDVDEITIKEITDPLTGKKITLSEMKKTLTGSLYIQPFLCNGTYDTLFVYACDRDKASDFGGDIHLIYNGGSWYYIDKVLVSDFKLDDTSTNAKGFRATYFDDSKNKPGSVEYENNFARHRWERFKNKYLTPNNKIS